MWYELHFRIESTHITMEKNCFWEISLGKKLLRLWLILVCQNVRLRFIYNALQLCFGVNDIL